MWRSSGFAINQLSQLLQLVPKFFKFFMRREELLLRKKTDAFGANRNFYWPLTQASPASRARCGHDIKSWLGTAARIQKQLKLPSKLCHFAPPKGGRGKMAKLRLKKSRCDPNPASPTLKGLWNCFRLRPTPFAQTPLASAAATCSISASLQVGFRLYTRCIMGENSQSYYYFIPCLYCLRLPQVTIIWRENMNHICDGDSDPPDVDRKYVKISCKLQLTPWHKRWVSGFRNRVLLFDFDFDFNLCPVMGHIVFKLLKLLKYIAFRLAQWSGSVAWHRTQLRD